MHTHYKSSQEDEIDFFALWEKKNSKSKIKFQEAANEQTIQREVQDKIKEYTKEDEERRKQIQRAKQELYLLATSQHERANRMTREYYEKTRKEFLNIKRVLQTEMHTDKYKKSS